MILGKDKLVRFITISANSSTFVCIPSVCSDRFGISLYKKVLSSSF